jgi:serine/threonine protein kinase
LKPANVLIGAFGETYVTDWGLAARTGAGTRGAATASQDRAPSDGRLCGTPAYMSAEQARGDSAVDRRTDVFGLGAILYQMLTGRPPYEAADADDSLEMARGARYTPVTAIAPRAPRELVRICSRAMAVDPADRYPSVDAFRDDLERWLGAQPIARAPRRTAPAAGARGQARTARALAAAAVLCVAFWSGSRLSGAATLARVAAHATAGPLVARTAERLPATPADQ